MQMQTDGLHERYEQVIKFLVTASVGLFNFRAFRLAHTSFDQAPKSLGLIKRLSECTIKRIKEFYTDCSIYKRTLPILILKMNKKFIHFHYRGSCTGKRLPEFPPVDPFLLSVKLNCLVLVCLCAGSNAYSLN